MPTGYHINQDGTVRHGHGTAENRTKEQWHVPTQVHRTDPDAHIREESWNALALGTRFSKSFRNYTTHQKIALLEKLKREHDSNAGISGGGVYAYGINPSPTVNVTPVEETPATPEPVETPDAPTPTASIIDNTLLQSVLERVDNVEGVILMSAETSQEAKAATLELKRVTDTINRDVRSLDTRTHTQTNDIKLANDAISEIDNRLVKLEQIAQHTVTIRIQDATQALTLTGTHHHKFTTMLAIITALDPGDRNVWLAGPAGSGKTTAARQLAEALQLEYRFIGGVTAEHQLMGYKDAKGDYQRTHFRDMYENGGVMLLDECDSSSPVAILALQAAIANGIAGFPDKMVERHKNFYCLAAANTWGFGGDALYVGRAKLDAAFLDRFVTVGWGYDEFIERILAGGSAGRNRTITPEVVLYTQEQIDVDDWIDVVQATRAAAVPAKAQVVISPRASAKGAQMLRARIHPAIVVEAIFGRYRGLTTWAQFGKEAERFAAKRITPAQSTVTVNGEINLLPVTPAPVTINGTLDKSKLPTDINRVDFSKTRVFGMDN